MPDRLAMHLKAATPAPITRLGIVPAQPGWVALDVGWDYDRQAGTPDDKPIILRAEVVAWDVGLRDGVRIVRPITADPTVTGFFVLSPGLCVTEPAGYRSWDTEVQWLTDMSRDPRPF